ncbi:hypothetical protein Anas_10162 [Armadillidium nasatum]|uniref:Uncharacterized protein n=1 Tax=Armadillidium nasatum TaxID=96803 RepID=A0A5N5T3T0_9CRUS|nr:hypothetical protein Anas_10162 [Armadillidium nasatum]
MCRTGTSVVGWNSSSQQKTPKRLFYNLYPYPLALTCKAASAKPGGIWGMRLRDESREKIRRIRDQMYEEAFDDVRTEIDQKLLLKRTKSYYLYYDETETHL